MRETPDRRSRPWSNIGPVPSMGVLLCCIFFWPKPRVSTGARKLGTRKLGTDTKIGDRSDVCGPAKFRRIYLGTGHSSWPSPWRFGWGQTPIVGDLATDLRQPPRLWTDPLSGIPKVCFAVRELETDRPTPCWRGIPVGDRPWTPRMGTDPYSWGFGDGSAPATSVVDGPLVGDSESLLGG
jgi:hypothetical protein